MKYYIISGEASGDLHGSNLIKSLKKKDDRAQFRCWGGDMMKSAGAEIVVHYKEIAFMGFKEVLTNLNRILKFLKFCKKDIDEYQPDVVILIDYPGFNIRMAEYCKKKALKVIYYISPQVWAWKSSRVKKLKKYVDKMLVILPFEKEFYAKYDFEVDYIGHPLMDVLAEFKPEPDFKRSHGLPDKPLIALLPGSRKQEISRMLPEMLNIRKEFPDHAFVVAGAPGIEASFYQETGNNEDFNIVYNSTYDLFLNAEAGIVTSGTATLEAALFNMPMVVGYKGNQLSYMIGKMLINVRFISLVNLILERQLVDELIQNNFNTSELRSSLKSLIYDENKISRIKAGYEELMTLLGDNGVSDLAAEKIIELFPHIN